MFWTPAFAGATLQETFYETIKFDDLVKSHPNEGAVKNSPASSGTRRRN
jgi:hypothetical protein